MYIVSCRRMNSLGRKCGIECGENVFDEGVRFTIHKELLLMVTP